MEVGRGRVESDVLRLTLPHDTLSVVPMFSIYFQFVFGICWFIYKYIETRASMDLFSFCVYVEKCVLCLYWQTQIVCNTLNRIVFISVVLFVLALIRLLIIFIEFLF